MISWQKKIAHYLNISGIGQFGLSSWNGLVMCLLFLVLPCPLCMVSLIHWPRGELWTHPYGNTVMWGSAGGKNCVWLSSKISALLASKLRTHFQDTKLKLPHTSKWNALIDYNSLWIFLKLRLVLILIFVIIQKRILVSIFGDLKCILFWVSL